MIIKKINTQLLKNERAISVGIIDSGFAYIPKYAQLHGLNTNYNHRHGNRILSIFSALDKEYPLPNLKLHLVCYNPSEQYSGLIRSLKLMPQVDILSLSISWKDDNKQIKDLLFSKSQKICVPFTRNKPDVLYPSLYDGVITCSNDDNINADYSITPVVQYKGNSYAVPAMARLLAYNIKIENDKNGVDVHEIFKNYNNPFIQAVKFNENKVQIKSECPFCFRTLRTKQHTLLTELPKSCPYCGKNIKEN